jgi:hypothetical protein
MTAMRSRDRRRPGPRALAVLLLAGVALTLSSCTGSNVEAQPTPSAVPGGVGSEPGAEEFAPSPTPSGAGVSTGPEGEASGGPATDGPASPGTPGADPAGIATSVEAALRALAEAQDPISRDQVRAAVEQGFADAGAAPEALEVSIDRTPTGLDVDAIQGSGLIGGRCIVGEIREGTVSVTVLPVLATGLCFVGDQR